MKRTTIQVTLACLALAMGCGCVRETISSVNRPKILDFSDSITSTGLWPVGFPHGINLIAELGDEDLTRDERERLHRDLYRAQPYRDGRAEVWKIGRPHELVYSNGRFQVGGFNYTPRKRSKLFLFKERSGDFSFRFHHQKIIVKARRSWKPSVFYNTVELSPQDSDPGAPRTRPARRSRVRKQTVWMGEILQVGPTVIRIDPRHGGSWTVNDRNYRPYADRPLILEGVVRFAE